MEEQHIPGCIFNSLKPFIVKTQDTIDGLLKRQQEQQQTIEKQQKEIELLRRLVDLQEDQIFHIQSKDHKELQFCKDSQNDLSKSAPIPIGSDSGKEQSIAGGIWSRIYSIIDPDSNGVKKAVGLRDRGSIHSL